MANTIVQIKRSTITATPANGSLSAGELAISFASDKLFSGNAAGTGVDEIGGKMYVNLTKFAADQANAAFDKANTSASNTIVSGIYDAANASYVQANTARDHANAAFDKANSANVLAYNIGIGSNAWTNTVFGYSNTYTQTVGAAANGWANSISLTRATAANAYAVTVGAAANSYANTTFVKLVAPNQTITGNLAVSGSLIVSGNSYVIDTETLRVSDPLIYLAGNNYTSDIVDIGFVANYNNGSANLHTGFFRDFTTKEYYIFEGYTQEPDPNHIDTTGNNFTISVLNATLRTSNLILGGANAILTIGAAFNVANAANLWTNTVFGYSNTYTQTVGAAANGWANSISLTRASASNTWTNTVFGYSNTYTVTVGAASNGWANTVASASAVAANTLSLTRASASNGWANTVASASAVAANTFAATVGAAANTNAANGSYISAGVVKVPYGGTGVVSFTQNGILFGNSAGDLKVTAAGTEGQVLQATATGVPQFGMLDGGNF